MHTNMATQLHILQEELEHYDKELLKNGRLVVVNKMDALGKAGDNQGSCRWSVGSEFEGTIQRLRESSGLPVVPISALSLWNITPLKEALFRMCNSGLTQGVINNFVKMKNK